MDKGSFDELLNSVHQMDDIVRRKVMSRCTCTKDPEKTCIIHTHDYEKVRVLAAENIELLNRGDKWKEKNKAAVGLVNKLGERAKRKEKLLAELKEAVRTAYIEGWVDGRNTTSVDGDPAYDWQESDSRMELKELSDEHV